MGKWTNLDRWLNEQQDDTNEQNDMTYTTYTYVMRRQMDIYI